MITFCSLHKENIQIILKLSIIIVSYNVCSYLRQCLQSIIKSDRFGEYEIIIIDNYSHDDSCRMVENEYHEIKLIKNKVNNLSYTQGLLVKQINALCIKKSIAY